MNRISLPSEPRQKITPLPGNFHSRPDGVLHPGNQPIGDTKNERQKQDECNLHPPNLSFPSGFMFLVHAL